MELADLQHLMEFLFLFLFFSTMMESIALHGMYGAG